MSRQAMQMALDALEWNYRTDLDNIAACEQWVAMLTETVAALRAALAEPEQPVAWRTFDGEGGWDYRTYEDNENYRDEYIKRNGERYASWVEPLYTAPTPRKPLSEKELDDLRQADGGALNFVTLRAFRVVARAVEAAHGIGEQT